jgi:hypothetical protein
MRLAPRCEMRTSKRRLAAIALTLMGLAAMGSCGSSRNGGQATGADGGGADGTTAGDAASPSDGAGPSDGGSSSDGAPLQDAAHPTPDPCIEAGTCPPGQWVDVTPAAMSPSVLAPTANAFGPGAIVGDPVRPSDMYIACGGDGVWKSTDYGNTWTQTNTTIGYSPIGTPIAVAGTTPATLWISSGAGDGHVYKSTDGASTFTLTGGGLPADLYSIRVDPYDTTHLISGLHEVDGLVESTDGGDTWHLVSGTGWPSGGISWYPSFIDTGSAATTRGTWFAIAQDGAAPVITSNEGASFGIADGLALSADAGPLYGLQHPHGSSNFYQTGSTLFVGGVYGPGQGVYRSTDLGTTWSQVDTGTFPEAIVWGTPKSVYAMYGWACSDCSLGTDWETAPQPGTTWTAADSGTALVIGPNSIVVTNDGSHSIFVGAMWAAGIWRYVEP